MYFIVNLSRIFCNCCPETTFSFGGDDVVRKDCVADEPFWEGLAGSIYIPSVIIVNHGISYHISIM